MPCGSSKEKANHDENNHCAFEDLDHSVLQQPLNLGVTNVKQILRCIQNGSKEVKDIILNECNIIYECKVCDGLFRSLANFLYHKRCYCKNHLCEGMLLFENFDEEIVTVNPEPPPESTGKTNNFLENPKLVDCRVNLVKSNLTERMESKSKGKPDVPEASKEKITSFNQDESVIEEPEKTDSSMISRRTRNKIAQPAVKIISTEEPPIKSSKLISARIIRKGSDGKTNAGSKEDVSNASKDGKTKRITITKFPNMKKKNESPFPKVVFKTIDSNPHAVFQSSDKRKMDSLGSATKAKDSKDQVIIVMKKNAKIETCMSKSAAKIKGESEKLSEFHVTRRKRLMSRNDCDVSELRCLACKTQFMSLKTLYFHMLSLHSKKRLYYPCPFCKTLFVQMYGVTRHLISIHNKSKEQVSKLRDVIKKKSVWKKIDDVHPSNESIFKSSTEEITPEPKEVVKMDEEVKPENVKIISIPKPVVESVSYEQKPVSNFSIIEFGKNNALHPCNKCGRVFGRKSSQVSHEKFCIINRVVKKEIVDDPPVVSPTTSVTSPVLSFITTTLQKQTPTTPQKLVALTPPKQTIPISQKQATHTPQKQATHSPQKQITYTPQKQASPKAACVLQIGRPRVTSINKPCRLEVTPVNRPAVDMPANMFNVKLSTRPKRGAEKQMHKDFVNSQTLKWRSANRVDTSVGHKTQAHVKKVSGKNLEKKVQGFMNSEDLTCTKCDKKFSSYSNLRRHVAIHVGWTRFKCKYCDYQAYNKSQCWAHVQKSHAVEEEEVEKCIVHLTNSSPGRKSLQKSPVLGKQNVNAASQKSAKCITKISKKKKISVKKQPLDLDKVKIEPDFEDPKMKSEKVQTVASASKKELLEVKKEKSQATITFTKLANKDNVDLKNKPQAMITIQKFPSNTTEDGKKEKPQHAAIPLQKFTLPDRKKDVNYKTVTTSNPTTIILSKTIPSSKVQSTVPISPESGVSAAVSQTRSSPRKTETKVADEKPTSSVVEISPGSTKITPIQIKLQGRTSSIEEAPQDSGVSNCPKKQKLVSEWFPKKDLPSSVNRRESAPLIIGLVPAANSHDNSTKVPEGEK